MAPSCENNDYRRPMSKYISLKEHVHARIWDLTVRSGWSGMSHIVHERLWAHINRVNDLGLPRDVSNACKRGVYSLFCVDIADEVVNALILDYGGRSSRANV